MVRGGLDAGVLQRGGRGFGFLPGRRVHQRPAAPDEPGQDAVLRVLPLHRHDAQVDIGPVEPGDDDVRARQAQELDDVVAHLGRRRRGERRDGRPARAAVPAPARGRRLAQPAVVGPEVVAPFRDAMGFVDDEARDRHVAQHLHEMIRREPLRRDIEQAQLARSGRPDRVRARIGGQHRVQRRGADPPPVELVDLVLHQRDERRHDQRRARQHQRGQLEPQRLPGAGRHDGQDVPPLQHGPHEGLLAGAEGLVAEMALEGGAEIDHRAPDADRMNAATSRFSSACADGRMYIMWPPS